MSTLPQNLNQKQLRNRRRHDFLLTFFDLPHKYEPKEVNGFMLVRFFNTMKNEWEVAIYTKENWDRVQKWKQKNALTEQLPL